MSCYDDCPEIAIMKDTINQLKSEVETLKNIVKEQTRLIAVLKKQIWKLCTTPYKPDECKLRLNDPKKKTSNLLPNT